eukprot:3403434-Rhodomonas_salina.1
MGGRGEILMFQKWRRDTKFRSGDHKNWARGGYLVERNGATAAVEHSVQDNEEQRLAVPLAR